MNIFELFSSVNPRANRRLPILALCEDLSTVQDDGGALSGHGCPSTPALSTLHPGAWTPPFFSNRYATPDPN